MTFLYQILHNITNLANFRELFQKYDPWPHIRITVFESRYICASCVKFFLRTYGWIFFDNGISADFMNLNDSNFVLKTCFGLEFAMNDSKMLYILNVHFIAVIESKRYRHYLQFFWNGGAIRECTQNTSFTRLWKYYDVFKRP